MPRAKIKKKKEIYIFFFKKSSNTAIIKARKKTIRTIEKKTGKKKLGKSLSVSGVDRCCRSSIVSFFFSFVFFCFCFGLRRWCRRACKTIERRVPRRDGSIGQSAAGDRCRLPGTVFFFAFCFFVCFFLGGFGPPWWIARFYPRNAHVQPSNNQSNPVKPSKIQVKTEKKSLRNPMKTCTHRSSPCLTRKTERNRVKPSKITKNSNKKPWEACPTLVAHMNQTRVFKIITKCSRVKPIKTQ